MNQNLLNIQDSVAKLDLELDGMAYDLLSAQSAIGLLQTQLEAARRPQSSGITQVMPFINKRQWEQPGAVGNSNPQPGDPAGEFIMTPGDVAVWSAKGIAPYNNGFYLCRNNGIAGFTRLIYLLDIMHPTAADISACRCIEFEIQQKFDGHIFNCAWQLPVNSGGQVWRTFDYTNKKWIETGVKASKFAAGAFIRVAAEYYCDLDKHETTHLSLTVDGVKSNVDITRPATLYVPRDPAKPGPDYLNPAFQQDVNGKNPPTPYKTYTREMHVIYG